MNVLKKVVEGGAADPVLVSEVRLGDLLPVFCPAQTFPCYLKLVFVGVFSLRASDPSISSPPILAFMASSFVA